MERSLAGSGPASRARLLRTRMPPIHHRSLDTSDSGYGAGFARDPVGVLIAPPLDEVADRGRLPPRGPAGELSATRRGMKLGKVHDCSADVGLKETTEQQISPVSPHNHRQRMAREAVSSTPFVHPASRRIVRVNRG